jgi:hypothetical protein
VHYHNCVIENTIGVINMILSLYVFFFLRKKIQEKEYTMELSMEVENEQLSPVSVMDFPLDEEEEDDVATSTTSPSPFHRSTANNAESA